MKRLIFYTALSLSILCSLADASAQERCNNRNESWRDRPLSEVTLSLNAVVKEFQYYDYNQTYAPEQSALTTNTLQAPTINIGFMQKVNKRITVGAIAAYAQSNYAQTALYDNAILSDDIFRYYSIAPRVRFDWYNGKYVTLYSSLALGIGYLTHKETVADQRSSKIKAYGEATYIGVKAGKRVFGFADLSTSSAGFIRVGVGYNFNIKK